MDAYEFSNSGPNLPRLGAFVSYSDEVNLEEGGVEARGQTGGQAAETVVESEGLEPREEKAQRKFEKSAMEGEDEESLELSSLMIGLHRRVLWRVYKHHKNNRYQYAEPA